MRRSVADPPLRPRASTSAARSTCSRRPRARGVRHVVFASTGGAIYGETDVVPTPEDAPERPLAPYGQAKLAAEGYLRLLGRAARRARRPACASPTSTARGRTRSARAASCAIFCGAAVAGRGVTIFGDGEQTRDFVYVGDVVDACLRAADGAPFGPFNIGTGVETSVNALARAARRRGEHAPPRPGEVERSCLDPSRAAARARLDAPRPTSPPASSARSTWARAQPS